MEKISLDGAAMRTPGGLAVKMSKNGNIPFSQSEYLRRLDQVVQGMGNKGVDALLVRGPENITYLTGYETPGYYGYHLSLIHI